MSDAGDRRVELRAGGMIVTQFLSLSIDRDLQNISGTMQAEIFDRARVDGAYTLSTDDGNAYTSTFSVDAGTQTPLREGMQFSVLIDGELVMAGHLGRVRTRWAAGTLTTSITGRDRTGDLADCAAVPTGPAEFKNVDLLHVAQALTKKFDIDVRADVLLGDKFVRLAIGPHETVLAAIEKGARQRAVLVTSDGIGGLLLTKGGSSRAPAPLVLGGNVVESNGDRSWEHRFSDYFVKGQTERCRGARNGVAAHLDSTVVPFTTGGGSGRPAPAAVVAPEASAILMTGHAIDPEIDRWRPTVRLTRSQSGSSTTQEQAEWALRVARGEGDILTYTVLDWRADPDDETGILWRPNQVTPVFDPVALIDSDMLIAGVRYSLDATGLKTTMRVVGVTAYDRINEAEKRRHRLGKKAIGPLDSTPTPLTAP